jgi:hypothetical protein
MDDAEIRKLLLERAKPLGTDGSDCFVLSTDLDHGIDRTPIRAWVERQERGRVERHAAVQGGGLRPNQRVARADSYVPPRELYVFPRAALDGDSA